MTINNNINRKNDTLSFYIISTLIQIYKLIFGSQGAIFPVQIHIYVADKASIVLWNPWKDFPLINSHEVIRPDICQHPHLNTARVWHPE